jgi:hypothetical protein
MLPCVLSGATDCYFTKHVMENYTQQYKNNDDDDDDDDTDDLSESL